MSDIQAVRSPSGGGPVTELFDAALGPPRVSAGPFSLWTEWSGRAGNLAPLAPRVELLLPGNGARLSGTKVLDAARAQLATITGQKPNVRRARK